MIIRLDQISDEPYRWQERRAVSIEALESDQLVDLSEVFWEGEIKPTSSGHLLTARLAYQQALACPRCLKPSPHQVAVNVELLLLSHRTDPLLGDRQLEEPDLSVLYVEDLTLDTEPILLEQLQLNIPMRKLCRDDCAGLCPHCGVDRNFGACSCANEDIDPRWAALENLGDSKE